MAITSRWTIDRAKRRRDIWKHELLIYPPPPRSHAEGVPIEIPGAATVTSRYRTLRQARRALSESVRPP